VGKLPIWLGVGGSPESALRAGDLGLPPILSNFSQPPADPAEGAGVKGSGAAAGVAVREACA
jgi:alkanesulfonate monooxygenase SsuD/methylene tetrahydromethanopterin reductase-like flavin-dependent oxidoreductase (luciferase family)